MTGEYATYIPLLDKNDEKNILANSHNLPSKNEEFFYHKKKRLFQNMY